MPLQISRAARIILGLIYFIFGLNFFYNLNLPIPPLPEEAMPYLNGLGAAPYFYTVLKSAEVISGIMMLTGIFAPIGLIVAAPITIQIALFHAYLTPGIDKQILPVIMIVCHVLAAFEFKNLFKPMFRRNWPL